MGPAREGVYSRLRPAEADWLFGEGQPRETPRRPQLPVQFRALAALLRPVALVGLFNLRRLVESLPAVLDLPGPVGFLRLRQIPALVAVLVENRLALLHLTQARVLLDFELPLLEGFEVAVLLHAVGLVALAYLRALPVGMILALRQFDGATGETGALHVEFIEGALLGAVDALDGMPVSIERGGLVAFQGAVFFAVPVAKAVGLAALLRERVGGLRLLPLGNPRGRLALVCVSALPASRPSVFVRRRASAFPVLRLPVFVRRPFCLPPCGG